jgi:2-polyprenyl-6-methoxyphenol hydroxylase-like FAD-dependent oxidoreductase
VSEPRGERVVDVVVVGAGPVGLWLAAELRLAGADVLVLERLPGPTQLTKSLTVHPRTLELLAMRGLADRCLALGKQVPSSHFALMSNRLDFTVLDTNYPFALFLPQPQLEAVLAEHANAVGVPVLREHTVQRVREGGGVVACASDLGIADRPEWAGIRAVLLRPDGHIAWVGVDASQASAAHLGRALARWFDGPTA